jgi:RimJ/RimL family protein N-acetyltransferase
MTYRPAGLDDAELASDLMSAAYPAMTQDPVVIRYRWTNPPTGSSTERFIAESDGEAIAFLAWFHRSWDELPDRNGEIEVWLVRHRLDVRLLRSMWSWLGDRAVAAGARLLVAYSGEDEPEMLQSLADEGYQRERIEKVWELDLRRHGARLTKEAGEARAKMSSDGIELTTVDQWHCDAKLRKLHELDERTREDVPTSLPIHHEAYADFVKRTGAPDRRWDRTWVALDGDNPAAMSYLKFPPVRGSVWTGYTCSHPDYRGRGIARAVKLQTLAQGAELGIPVVLTGNDAENAPMLHINERLGYVRRPGFVEHHKRVETPGNA